MADARFFKKAGSFSLTELAHIAGAQIAGSADAGLRFSDVKPLSSAGPQDVSFIDNRRYMGEFSTTKAGAILAVPMTGVATLIQNAGFLLVPAWVSLGTARSWGVERIGQGIFTTLGLILVMAFSLLPAALIFAVTWLLSSAYLGNSMSLPVSALPAAAALAAECWLGVELLGAYLDRFDPSRELDSLTRSA